MMKAGVVYVATNTTNNKQYVGLTLVGVTKRWANHVAKSRNPKTYFHKAIAKYGVNAFNVVEYASAISNDALANLEREVIFQLRPAYNQTNGGEVTFGRKYDDATKERIRLSNTGKKRTLPQRNRNREAKLAWFAAHPEERAKSAERLKLAKTLIDEEKRRAAVGMASKNRVWSDESRAKLSASCIGRRYGPEIISRMAEAKKRKVRCDSTGAVYSCKMEAAQACGVSPRSIQRVCSGEYPSVKGLKFSYAG